MGPFPHDAPPAKISKANPAGTDGFEFVEFAHSEPGKLRELFTRMGYVPVAAHKTKEITVWRQGDINYVINAEPGSHAMNFVEKHGPCAPSMAWRVVDAKHAFDHAVAKSATPYEGKDKTLDVPAIVGIGGSLIYFVETYGKKGSAYDAEFDWLGEHDPKPEGVGFYYLDHLTHNVFRGQMDKWWAFYRELFGFKQIHFFDIAGKMTGLVSRAITSPCGKIRIPLNESTDDKSQIEEYLRKYKSSATDAGTRNAAPTPCRQRAPTRVATLGAIPHRNEPSRNTTTPPRKTRLRPSRSPVRPPTTSSAPNTME